MSVDSFKYLPRLIAAFYQATDRQPELPIPWTPLVRPLPDCKFGLVTSGGLYHKGIEPPFDVAREKGEPTWGDPTYRTLPAEVRQAEVEFPFGHTLGQPHDAAQQTRVIRQALAVLETAKARGTIVHSPETWPVPRREAYKDWQPEEPPPIIQTLAPQFREMVKGRRKREGENQWLREGCLALLPPGSRRTVTAQPATNGTRITRTYTDKNKKSVRICFICVYPRAICLSWEEPE